MEIDILELTALQSQALGGAETVPLRLVNPSTQERFVLLREVEYERLTEEGYDDTGFTEEDRQALIWEMFSRQPENIDEYDRVFSYGRSALCPSP